MTHAEALRVESDRAAEVYVERVVAEALEPTRAALSAAQGQLDTALADLNLVDSEVDQLEGKVRDLEAEVARLRALVPTEPEPPAMRLVYEYDPSPTMTGLGAWSPYQSTRAVNDGLLPTDSTNNALQKPSLSSLCRIVADPDASNGRALALLTRQASYATSAGEATGWCSSRGGLHVPEAQVVAPADLEVRLRATASVGTKWAVMLWPSAGGWPWEVDFAEVFGGWVAAGKCSQRWHADLDGDGRAVEQLVHDFPLDLTAWHTFRLRLRPDSMSVLVDDVLVFETRDPRFFPTGPGHLSIGKALTGTRDGQRSDDDLLLDYARIYAPT